ncbi:MAG TPA: HEAT repeat domain-containing protein [Nocardiopsis listeri]|uniref:HEAT repeat domain-containing protein n=1 Tax=Nocardiopsis listeri TaxID=53440 RepID=UPI001DE050EF|nr:HEAT repeat domain-containing protein [Nocardiopsis listeri]HJE59667.1 HEAT repeat domain-containing protein [Nocardiopsis listeri]
MPEDTPDNGLARRLLADIAPLTGPRRMRHAALYARENRYDPRLSETLADLDVLGEAELGAHMALAARDPDLVERYLNGPDEDLRRFVLARTPGLSLPDRIFEELLDDASHRLRRTFYSVLYRDHRTTVADRVLPVVRERHGDHEAGRLLAACSTSTVDAHLDDLAHRVESWSGFARRHPEALLTRLERERDTARNRERIWDRPWARMADALSGTNPELLVPFLRGRPAPESSPPPYVKAHRLLRAGGDQQHYPARYPAYARGRRDVGGLVKAMHDAAPRTLPVLRVMSYEDRTPIIDRFVAEGGGERAALLPYLSLLPKERAVAEAGRILEYLERSLAAHPDHTHRDVEALAHLPFEEAEPALSKAAGDADPVRREHALYWLVVAAGRAGADTLARVLTARTARSAADRDQVRRSLPLALGVLPPDLPTTDALPDLYRLLDDDLAAPDTTRDTRWALGHLGIRVLRHPGARGRTDLVEWALTALARLIEQHGGDGVTGYGSGAYASWHRRPTLGRWWTLAEVLTPVRARELYDRLAPALSRARARGDHHGTVVLARALGPRLYAIPPLLDHDLREVVLADPTSHTAHEAAELHLRGSGPGRRAERLFRAAPATILLQPVWERLARMRPALVPEALAEADRLSTDGKGTARRSVWIHRGLTRTWSVSEHTHAAEYLRALAADTADKRAVRAEALDGLSVLSGALDHLLSRIDDDPWARETVLVRLARCGEPERALGVLLDHVDEGTSSRAVVAVLDSCARRVRPSNLTATLGGVLAAPGRVGVRKTAARVLGRARPPGAVELLVDILDQDALHRDVRAAVLGALMAASDHPAVLPALEARVDTFGDSAARSALSAHSPWDLRPNLRARAARLMASLPETGDPAIDERLDVCRWIAGWALWDAELADGLVADLHDLSRSDERVLRTFEGLLREPRYEDRLPALVAELADLCPTTDQEVPLRPPEVDRAPSLPRRTVGLVRMLAGRVRSRQDMTRPVPDLDTAVERLAAHTGLSGEALILRLADLPALTRNRVVPARVFAARVLAWADLAAHHPGDPSAAPKAALAALVPGRIGHGVGSLGLAALLHHLADLALRDTTAAGRPVGLLAVALVEQEGRRQGWTGPWARIIADLGGSPHEDVRVAAWRAAIL